MDEWDSRPLNELAQITMGQSPPGSFVVKLNSGLPFLQGNAEFNDRYPRAIFQCDEAPRQSAPGDSLVSVRAPVGAINRSDRPYGIGRGLAAVTFVMIDANFGHYALVERSLHLHSVAQGTTFSAIDRTGLAALRLPVPPFEEQQRIADILKSIDDAIFAAEGVADMYHKVRAGLSTDLLSGNSRIANGWAEFKLGDLGTVIGGGTPSRERAEYWNGSIPWLTPGELTAHSDKYITETQDYISELGLAESSAKLVPQGTLLITSRASLGLCALAGRPMATNQGFTNLIPQPVVDPSYLFHLGRSLRREMTRRASGTTFLEISGSEFARIAVKLPPLKEQKRIANILDTVDETIRVNQQQLDKLRQIRSGLASDLISGQIRTG